MKMETNPAFTFRHLTLYEAEGRLVHRCLTDRALLTTSLESLPEDCFRTNETFKTIFFALVGMDARGAYDPVTNEAYMARALAAVDKQESLSWWEHFLDDHWHPEMAVDEYACALLADLIDAYRDMDKEIAIVRRNHYESRFAFEDTSAHDAMFLRLKQAIVNERAQRVISTTGPATPQPARMRSPKKKGGFVGGVPL